MTSIICVAILTVCGIICLAIWLGGSTPEEDAALKLLKFLDENPEIEKDPSLLFNQKKEETA